MPLRIPTEPIGGIPRPASLLNAIRAGGIALAQAAIEGS
jgi:hypothetical protein